MRQSGLAGLLPSLREAVYVGVSGGSALGMVDFSLFPHLDHEDMPDFSMAGAEEWAAGLPMPGYAIDDQTAIKVTDGTVEVVSEGHWNAWSCCRSLH